MSTPKLSYVVFMFMLYAAALASACCDNFDTAGMSRKSFPEGFVFGTATSAYQVEGMTDKDGRGPSIWDHFVHTPGNIAGNATADVTVDQYHKYKEDIDLMKNLNFDAYRFSISWSRIFPNGTGEVNPLGVAYYNRMIDYLVEKGITPYANLYHYDLPQALQDRYNGMLGCQFVFLHPITYGEYPKTMQEIVGDRLPKFSDEEVLVVKGSLDILGVNQYTTFYMFDPPWPKSKDLGYQADWNVGFAFEKNGVPVGPRANSGWLYIVPRGLHGAVMYVKERYGNPTMILSENGMIRVDFSIVCRLQQSEEASQVVCILVQAVTEKGSVKEA
ncbi:hypothetical protein JRO89_XS02G0229000 [Xanthoceras sorbifolium]|uniref:Beta-glucosidase n=1 Tax=Xanthoceras sorbifolium TaxID=99658 RepID=A0ABQ8IGU0_9ROSI|nr:hypothetical protein JRO89_XS02G0229000 [Xanthoceras sorbifolium]